MNLLGRLLLGVDPAQRVTIVPPRPPLVGCPDCGGLEHAVIVTLTGYRLEPVDGVRLKAVREEVGARLSCQRCPCVFSVGPLGTFRHHARSLPYAPQIPEAGQAAGQKAREPSLPPRNSEPVPRPAPAP